MTFPPPRLGPGAIYLRSLDDLFRSNPDLIQVAEIEPQSLWTKATAPDAVPRGSPGELRHLATLPQRRLTHGVGYPIGGTLCDQDRHIPEFRSWSRELASPWTSEHLSILHVRSAHSVRNCGFLMPPLQTEAQVQLAAHNIRQRREALGLPFAFETGVNYFARRDEEIPDGEFFADIAEAADCGILLDLTNLWVNDRNGRTRISDVLSRLPLERVWEVHLAGIEFAHGYWLDAHCGSLDPELVAIAADVMPSLPNLGAIIFEVAPDRVPHFGPTAFLREMETLHTLWERATAAAHADRVPASVSLERSVAEQRSTKAAQACSPQAWESLIAQQLLPPDEAPAKSAADDLLLRSADEQSFTLYRRLISSFRAGTIAEILATTTRLMLISLGEQELRQLIARYIAGTLPQVYATDEALQFRRYLQTVPIEVGGLEQILNFECALVEAAANGVTLQVDLPKDIEALLTDVAAGKLPRPSSGQNLATFEVGVGATPFIRMLEQRRSAS